MTIKIPFIHGSKGTTYLIKGKTYAVNHDDSRAGQVKKLLSEEKYDEAINLLTPREAVKTAIKGSRFVLAANDTLFDTKTNTTVHGYLVNKVIALAKEGLPITALLNFMERLELNPSYRIRERLYKWLEAAEMPLSVDGKFYAYKKVNANFTSCHDNTTKNDVGTTVLMERHLVDDNDNNPCSSGLHVCSRAYLPQFGTSGDNRIVLCLVDPADVVSIPTDYNDTKMRVCAYEVVEDVTGSFEEFDNKAKTASVVERIGLEDEAWRLYYDAYVEEDDGEDDDETC